MYLGEYRHPKMHEMHGQMHGEQLGGFFSHLFHVATHPFVAISHDVGRLVTRKPFFRAIAAGTAGFFGGPSAGMSVWQAASKYRAAQVQAQQQAAADQAAAQQYAQMMGPMPAPAISAPIQYAQATGIAPDQVPAESAPGAASSAAGLGAGKLPAWVIPTLAAAAIVMFAIPKPEGKSHARKS